LRLKKSEQELIKNTILSFDKNSKVVLFGSRADNSKKGGDIDLLVLSEKLTFDDKLKILTKLYFDLDEQKIDLIITNNLSNPFVKIALENGVYL
jgi:predicted nucleotidyltransferase